MEELEYFEKYQNGDLSSEEIMVFNQKLKNDEIFRLSYEDYKDMQSFLTAKPQIDKGKKEIQELRKQHERKTSGFRFWPYLLAAFVIIALLLFFVFRDNTPTNGPALYAEYYSPITIDLNTKSANSDNKNLSDALSNYNQGNYNLAFTKLDTMGAELSYIPQILLAKGISALELNKLDEANNIFQTIINNYSSFQNDANWYKALVFLKEGRFNEAESTLTLIPQESNYSKRSREIINAIQKFN